ncbi:MAG: peroxiredoxin [Deltaproteobacteria bacterium]|nr:peroxiredoxin [Deltaproteobacteria bacterium]
MPKLREKLSVGSKAPSFRLKDKNGNQHTLASIKGRYTVIYFYPRDNTPGCTVESKSFSDALAKFDKLGASIVGISGGDEKSKQKFCDRHKLNVLLLSDPEFQVATCYGSFGEKHFMGRKFKGILRKTFVTDSNLKIIKIYEKVTPASHAAEILGLLNALESKE